MNKNIQLKIRSLIADKEMITARANLDLARAGEWQCDYQEWHRAIDQEIEEVLGEPWIVSREPDAPESDIPEEKIPHFCRWVFFPETENAVAHFATMCGARYLYLEEECQTCRKPIEAVCSWDNNLKLGLISRCSLPQNKEASAAYLKPVGRHRY